MELDTEALPTHQDTAFATMQGSRQKHQLSPHFLSNTALLSTSLCAYSLQKDFM